MRQAKVNDHWRHIYTKTYTRFIRSFNFSNIAGVGSGEITFRGGINAICGGNGAGKSTLLDAIACATISPEYAKNYINHQRFTGTIFLTKLIIDQVEITRIMKFGEGDTEISGDYDCEITHLNPATLALSVTSFLNKTSNFAEVLESLDPKIAPQSQLNELSYIIGKNYENLETYEIEDYSLEVEKDEDYQSDENVPKKVFPYFKVTSEGITYNSETMGLGELSLFILFWMLHRISENSILLIEEPETYISPSSQKKFMDFMARMSDIKSIWIILTTHSPSIVDKIHLDKITLLSRGREGVTIIDTPSQFQLDEVLDKSHSYSGILLVEDAVARTFLSSILSRMALDVYKRYEILVAEDEGTLSKLKNGFPNNSAWFEIAVIYDGDQREKQVDGKIPHGFLPHTSAPEVLLQETAKNNLPSISNIINRPLGDLQVVVNSLQGRDIHDWLEELSQKLAIHKDSLIDVIVGICLETNEAAKSEAVDLVTKIRNAF